MNTKGLVALVIVNVGWNAGLITQRLFAMTVVMILVHTMLTGPLISCMYRLVRRQSFKADNENATLGLKRIIVVAASSDRLASEMVQIAALLFSTRRTLLHMFRFVDDEHDGAASSSSNRAEMIEMCAMTGMEHHIDARVIETRVPQVLSRVTARLGAFALLVSATNIAALTRQQLCEYVPCNVLMVVGSIERLRRVSSMESSQSHRSRIVVIYVGGAHDDLALDIAVGVVSSLHFVLIIKCLLDDDEDARTSPLNQQLLQPVVPGVNIDVLWLSGIVVTVERVMQELQTNEPAVLLIGSSSPVLTPLTTAIGADDCLSTPVVVVRAFPTGL